MSELNPVWHALQGHFQTIRGVAFNILTMIPYSSHPAEETITDHVDDFNQLMNELLFDSKSFSEALDRLENLRRRADDFIRSLRIRSN
jgi:hypothetical protein